MSCGSETMPSDPPGVGAPPAARRTTLRLRLTLWSAVVTLAVHGAAGAVLFALLPATLYAEVDGVLEGEMQELAAKVRRHPDDLPAAAAEIRAELGKRIRRDLRFRLLDEAGRVLIDSDPDGGFPEPPPGGEAFDTAGHLTVEGSGGAPPMRVHRTALALPGRTTRAEVTYSLGQVRENLRGILWTWLGTLPLTGMLAAAGGWFVARAGLRPLTTMAAAAEAVRPDGSGGRLATAETGDELDGLAATINRMLDRIEGHVRRVRDFTADASHEFRTPLAALKGTAELALSRDRPAGELREVLVSAVEQYDRLSRIADDLLLLARADAGGAVLRLGPVGLERLATTAAELYAAAAESAGVTLTCRTEGAPTVQGDADRLLQMLGNLLDNALRHTPAGGTVELTAGIGEGEAVLIVRDTGRGIAAGHLPHLFERFVRVEDGRARGDRTGAGLGLGICRAVAGMHGGRISVTSTVGVGTTFRVGLPLARATAAPA